MSTPTDVCSKTMAIFETKRITYHLDGCKLIFDSTRFGTNHFFVTGCFIPSDISLQDVQLLLNVIIEEKSVPGQSYKYSFVS